MGPDYALVHEDVADEFVEELQRWIHEYYGEDVLASPDYPHMINQKHFDMVCRLIDDRPQGHPHRLRRPTQPHDAADRAQR